MDLSPLDYMLKMFPEFKDRDEMRKVIGRYGISGKAQVGHNDTTNSKYLICDLTIFRKHKNIHIKLLVDIPIETIK